MRDRSELTWFDHWTWTNTTGMRIGGSHTSEAEAIDDARRNVPYYRNKGWFDLVETPALYLIKIDKEGDHHRVRRIDDEVYGKESE